jgi:hypothetical protein
MHKLLILSFLLFTNTCFSQIICSNPELITLASLEPASGISSIQNQIGITYYYTDCNNLIAKIISSGNNPYNGPLEVTIGNWPNSEYLSRIYSVRPINTLNGEIFSTKITLFFTQQEFNSYNLTHPNLLLPINSLDIEGFKSNINILQITDDPICSICTNITYLENIKPNFDDINWVPSNDSEGGRWEITFFVGNITLSSNFSSFRLMTGREIMPLPLNLISFSAFLKNESTKLTWQTDNEVNTKSFEIERSEDGTKFIKIGTVASKNNFETNEYSFLDSQFDNQNSNAVYYRLKMLDLKGKFTYSKIVAVSLKNNKSISISPNPTSGKALLNLGNKTELINKMATLTNSSGIVFKQFKINKLTEEIDLSELPKAIYLVKFEDGTTLKVIKE